MKQSDKLNNSLPSVKEVQDYLEQTHYKRYADDHIRDVHVKAVLEAVSQLAIWSPGNIVEYKDEHWQLVGVPYMKDVVIGVVKDDDEGVDIQDEGYIEYPANNAVQDAIENVKANLTPFKRELIDQAVKNRLSYEETKGMFKTE